MREGGKINTFIVLHLLNNLQHLKIIIFRLRMKERTLLLDNALNTFCLLIHDIGHKVKDHSEKER